MILKDSFYVLTGGPGAGKTTLIEQLTKKGYNCIPEVGRKIIKEQLSFGGTALPWSNTDNYANFMLQYSLQDYISHYSEMRICFFDRGIPDILGYAELINMPNQALYINSVENFRYNSTVFILPPWEDIYIMDSERKQDFKLATTTYNTMKKVYEEYGYNLIEVPCMSISERINFIIDRIG